MLRPFKARREREAAVLRAALRDDLVEHFREANRRNISEYVAARDDRNQEWARAETYKDALQRILSWFECGLPEDRDDWMEIQRTARDALEWPPPAQAQRGDDEPTGSGPFGF